MAYVDDYKNIQRHAEMLQKLSEAFVRSKGDLKITLADGRTVRGKYYGAQCTPNSTAKLCCSAAVGDEEGEYLGVYDLLDIVAVEAVVSN